MEFMLIDSCEKFNLELGLEKFKDFQPDGRSKKFSYSECEYLDEGYGNDEFYTYIKNVE